MRGTAIPWITHSPINGTTSRRGRIHEFLIMNETDNGSEASSIKDSIVTLGGKRASPPAISPTRMEAQTTILQNQDAAPRILPRILGSVPTADGRWPCLGDCLGHCDGRCSLDHLLDRDISQPMISDVYVYGVALFSRPVPPLALGPASSTDRKTSCPPPSASAEATGRGAYCS